MSRYEQYEIKNNVFGTLSAPISSLATTIQLWDWQWARFSTNQLATLENIEDWKVKKREIVLITAINWDVLTVTRKYAPCPADDEANTQWQVSFSFWADDTISLYITKEHFDKIDDWFTNVDNSFDDVYENWTDELRTYKTTWLWVEVKPWKVLVWSAYYDFEWWTLTLTNNATNYIEIDEDWDLVVNMTSWTDENTKISKVITSWWEVTSIEDWRLWTVWWKIGWVNIHDLTEKENLDNDDEFIIADSQNIYQNKKIKAISFLQRPRYWDGSDWECVIDEDTTIQAREYNFVNLTICPWKTLCFCGEWVPLLRAIQYICNMWTIDTYWDICWASICSMSAWEIKSKLDCYSLDWGQWWRYCVYGWDWWSMWCSWCNWCQYCFNPWTWWTWTETAWWWGWWWWGWMDIWWNWCNASWWYWWDWWIWWYSSHSSRDAWDWWWGGFWLLGWWNWWTWGCYTSGRWWKWWNWWNSLLWNWWNWGAWWYWCPTWWDWWNWWDWRNWWNWWSWWSWRYNRWIWWNWGNWLWLHYWLWLFSKTIISCCIDARWWNWWNWWASFNSSNGWNWWSWWDIHIIYSDCLDYDTIDVSWWTGWCGCWGWSNWSNWTDWNLCIRRFTP